MTKPGLHVWQLRAGLAPQPLPLPGDTLDAVSRGLPQGFYTTFRTFGNCAQALDLDRHFARLYRPAEMLGLDAALAEPELRLRLRELLAAYRAAGGEARVRISLSAQEQPGSMVVAIEPLKRLPDQVYRDGVRVVSSQAARVDPRLKSSAFITQSDQARREVARAGAFEGLLLRNGRILEGITSNFFYIRDGVLGTARNGILLGVTRRLVLRLARRAGVPVDYRPLRAADVGAIEEAFISSSSRGIVPVVAVDGAAVGDARPGPITRQLMHQYDANVDRRARMI